MIPQLPIYVSIVFGLTTCLALACLFISFRQSSSHRSLAIPFLIGAVVWLGLQMLLALNGFYSNNPDTIPPKFLLAIGPPLILILFLFVTEKGKAILDDLPLLPITYMHTVRVPVELVLYWLFLYGAVPELMTFAGRNFDILAGITAPFVAYVGMQKGLLNTRGLLVWNMIALGLVLFIVVNALLSAPLPFQQFAFDQPNVGVFYFPFVWLPAFVVPAVFFGHFTAIRRLRQRLRQAVNETAVPA
ncbi:MAG: hypothetical protein AAF587_04795 [Bacteroidota bacterium]